MKRRACLVVTAILVLLSVHSQAANPAAVANGHAPGSREQWQPQFAVGGWDLDPRLNSHITVDILGRSAISALAELSKQTGVPLQIAPENLATVGQRKLSLFVHDAELKAVMVQIPEALRECHWDIGKSGEVPVYYLHRNAGGADPSADARGEGDRLKELARAKRVARLEELKRALAMSPEQLKELEKEDLFLAKALQDEDKRAEAGLFFALPPDQLQRFADTGRVQPRYEDLTSDAKAEFERLLRRMTHDPNLDIPNSPWPDYQEQEIYRFTRERVAKWRESSNPCVDLVNVGGSLSVGLPGIFLVFPVPPKYPTERDRGEFTSLVEPERIPTSMEDANRIRNEAKRIVSEWIDKGRALQAQQWDSSQQGEGQEPTDPVLLQPVGLRTSGQSELAPLQREIAGDTGLDLLSDYFSERPIAVSGSLTEPQPLWRLLNTLSAETECVWRKTGSYIVFHHIKWYGLSPGEMPEALVMRYRQRVADVGHLTIDDVAELATSWKPKDIRTYGIPKDLQDAGLGYSSHVLLLYSSLTPGQIAAARTSSGLACAELTMAQRKFLADMISQELNGPRMTMDEALARGHFRVEEIAIGPERTVRGTSTTEVLLYIQLGDERPRYPWRYWFPELGGRRDSASTSHTE